MSVGGARSTWEGPPLYHPRRRSYTKRALEEWSGKRNANERRVRSEYRHGGVAHAKLGTSDNSCVRYFESKSLALQPCDVLCSLGRMKSFSVYGLREYPRMMVGPFSYGVWCLFILECYSAIVWTCAGSRSRSLDNSSVSRCCSLAPFPIKQSRVSLSNIA